MASTTTETTVSVHPLDPLSAAEIARAWEIVRTEHARGPRVRVVFVMLHEPAKKVVLQHRPGDAVERAAFVVLVDSAAGKTYEAVVSVSAGRVLSWEHVPGVQPAIVLDEFAEIEAAVRADPRWQEAMRRRGVTDTSLAMVDAWSAGNFGFPEDEGRRLVRALTWVRRDAKDNGYARPVDGLLTVVDLNEMKVLRVEDGGVVPLPPEDGNYAAEAAGTRLASSRSRSASPRARASRSCGREVRWQKWRFRIGFTPREGLVLHTVELRGRGPRAPDPLPGLDLRDGRALRRSRRPTSQERLRHRRVRHRHAGQLAHARLRLPGRDPLLRRGASTTARATPSRSRTPSACTRRTPASCGSTPTGGPTRRRCGARAGSSCRSSPPSGNYEYGFYWYFYQDGSIQCEVKLTGIMNTTALSARARSRAYGEVVAPRLNAPFHQHIFAARLDMSVDGPSNSVYEVNTRGRCRRPGQPARQRLPRRGDAAGRGGARPSGSSTRAPVASGGSSTRRHEPAGRAGRLPLVPGENVLPFAAAGRGRHAARGLRDQASVGDAATIPASGTRPATTRTSTRAATACRAGRKADRPLENTDLVRLVHLRRTPRRPARGLAGDAGGARSASCSSRRASSIATRPRRPPPHGAW